MAWWGILLLLAGRAHWVQIEAPERIFTRALELHQAGDFEGAVREYRAFLAQRPATLAARSNLGAALAQLGRYEEAITEYRKALELDSSNSGVRRNLALAYYKSAQIPQAAAELVTLKTVEPGNLNAVLLLGDCYLRMGEFKKVIELLSPLEASHREDLALSYLLGTALIQDGQADKGAAIVDRILRNGDSAEAQLMLGVTFVTSHKIPDALKHLHRAIELNPKLPSLYSYYGQALLENGDSEGALEAFRTELLNNPNDFEANLYLGYLLKQDQKFEEALSYLRHALLVRPGDPGARYQTAVVNLGAGNLEEAQRTLESLAREYPNFTEAHVSLAALYYRQKRKKDGDLERAIVQRLESDHQARSAAEATGPAEPSLGTSQAPAESLEKPPR